MRSGLNWFDEILDESYLSQETTILRIGMKTKHKYTHENGKIIYHDKERLSANMKEFKEAWITVSDEKPTRSNQQNSYYWGVVNKMISDETGYTTQETHQILLCEVFGVNKKTVNEICYLIPNKSTSELNTVEMEEFLTKSREFASIAVGLYIPLPGEELNINL